jgi:methionyl-tRNA formyltransferase
MDKTVKLMTATKSFVFCTGLNKENLLTKIIEIGKNIAAVILPHSSLREERLYEVIKVAKSAEIPVLRPKQADLEGVLKSTGADTLVSAGYPYLFKPGALSVCRYNINIHPSLLPKYRGPAATWYILANGETEGGVTVHFIDQGMDTGNILTQGKFPLGPFDTIKSYMRKAAELEPLLLQAAIAELDRGETSGITQDEQRASSYPGRRSWQDSEFDPSLSVSELYNFIRACDAERFPAFFKIDGQRVGVKLFRPDKPDMPDDDDLI